MKKSTKITLTSLALIVLIIAIYAAAVRYTTEHKPHEIAVYSAADGVYTLTIYQIGEPDWPFGKTDCRLQLKRGDKTIVKLDMSIQDDGANAGEHNFTVDWHTDNVTVTAKASEQQDKEYVLYFDGTAKNHPSVTVP